MMFKTRKLTAALLAAGVMSTSMLVSNASAVEVSSNGAGNAVVVPYYTVNEGWQTLLNVSNTSGNSLAVKVRLHEAQNSRDVLDFNLALSPRDVWTAWISQDEDGRPVLRTEDRSCTIPLSVRDSGAAASELAYSGQFVDHTETDGTIPRMTEGYVEILVMGETEGSGDDADENGNGDDARADTAWYAEHVEGEPRNCGRVESDFIADEDNWDGSGAIPGDSGSGDPIARGGQYGYEDIQSRAPLKVNASLVNQDNGIAAGVESLHIAGFGMNTTEGGDFTPGEENLVTAQQFPWFLEPTIASTDGLWTMAGLSDLEDDIGARNVANEWATNPATGASSEWVVTFPTKRFHTDNDANNVQAACNQWRNLETGGGATGGDTTTVPFNGDDLDIMDTDACPLDPFTNRFQAENDGASAINVSYNIWDREEGTFQVETDGVTISPAPPPEITIDTLIHEANVVKIGRNVEALDSVLGSAIARSVETNQLVSDSQVGWAQMDFQGSVLPVTGFMFKQRDFGDASRNFGQATEHAFDTEEVEN